MTKYLYEPAWWIFESRIDGEDWTLEYAEQKEPEGEREWTNGPYSWRIVPAFRHSESGS